MQLLGVVPAYEATDEYSAHSPASPSAQSEILAKQGICQSEGSASA